MSPERYSRIVGTVVTFKNLARSFSLVTSIFPSFTVDLMSLSSLAAFANSRIEPRDSPERVASIQKNSIHLGRYHTVINVYLGILYLAWCSSG